MHSIKLIFQSLFLLLSFSLLNPFHQSLAASCDSLAPCEQIDSSLEACKQQNEKGLWDEQIKKLETRKLECNKHSENLDKTNKAIDTKNSSAKKEIRKHNQMNDFVTALNSAFAISFFEQCPADQSRTTCFMGLMSLQQALESQKNKKKHDNISHNLSSLSENQRGIASSNQQSLTSSPSHDFNGLGLGAQFDSNKDGFVGAGDLVPGCSDCKFLNSSPEEALSIKTPQGDSITEKEIAELDSKTKASMNKKMAFLKSNPPTPQIASLLQGLEDLESSEQMEEEEEEDGALRARASKFQGGSGIQSLSGNSSSRSSYKRRRRRSSSGIDLQAKINQVMGGFKKQNSKQNKKYSAVQIGKDKVGAIQDNIFAIIARRYQERKKHNQFMPEAKRTPTSYL